ncbi:serine/threonine protein kinase [Allorhodopirellula solitaria]|uniref:Serine/threonine-protein kinase PrkC n=1 Tax=Allorhodopirellula solitaria TaxID=2527987 RepID=A0A5C5YJJ2_9BACT|nr:serine/threonine-protein kinase [Allorhodopirellula solitaria]TWT75061.1 Serine/threonine-protein kinase PrkC [Allorhodopirellula solitaria]
MSPPLPADLVFREAALLSELVSESQWRAAVREVKQDRKKTGTAKVESDAERKTLCDDIAAILVRDDVITPYQATQLRAGRTKLTLGPYLVTEFIGKGGMGQVFGGVHEIMGRRCAIKVLPLDKSDELARESFHREIRLQASLDCPYLVRAFDAGREGSVHFLVTEYVPGTDLRRLVKESGRLSVQQAASIVAQAAAGLAYAHESGLIHRDIKPANILVTPQGHAKVADVGLAALISTPDDDPRAGKVVGTADYLSPEQIRTPDAVGPQCDVYSLGCTLYYAITGKVPFPGGDSRSKCKRHLTQAPWDPRRFAPELSDEFVEIIADMMEKDVDQRIESANEVVRRLSPWASMHPDEGESWLAERGIELREEPARTQRPSAFGMQADGDGDDLSWKTASLDSGGVGVSNSEVILDEPPVSSGGLSSITSDPPPPLPDQSGNLDLHFPNRSAPPIPPPPTERRRGSVSRSTLWLTVLLAILISGAAGFALAVYLNV